MDLEQHLRSTILKVKCLDYHFGGSPNCTWNIMVATRPMSDTSTNSSSGSSSSSSSSSNHGTKETALQNALTSGQWYVENECLSENLSGTLYMDIK